MLKCFALERAPLEYRMIPYSYLPVVVSNWIIMNATIVDDIMTLSVLKVIFFQFTNAIPHSRMRHFS